MELLEPSESYKSLRNATPQIRFFFYSMTPIQFCEFCGALWRVHAQKRIQNIMLHRLYVCVCTKLSNLHSFFSTIVSLLFVSSSSFALRSHARYFFGNLNIHASKHTSTHTQPKTHIRLPLCGARKVDKMQILACVAR